MGECTTEPERWEGEPGHLMDVHCVSREFLLAFPVRGSSPGTWLQRGSTG